LKSCPKEINTITKAQTYASTFLLQEAIKQANESLSSKKFSLSLNNNKKDQITTRRERIRDIMKQIDVSIPCIGRVAFDSNGINKFLKFDLLLVNNKQSSIVTAEQFSAAVEKGISLDTLKIIE
jgi:hypothetical protein